MAGEDTTSSALEPAPKPPLSLDSLDPDFLHKTAAKLIDATWKSGLPQWSWGEGVYLLAEVRYQESANNGYPERLKKWFHQWNAITSGHVNNVAPGAAALRLAAHKELDSRDIETQIENWLADKSSVTYSEFGAIEHWPGSVWADTCYMWGQYRLNSALKTANSEMVEAVGKQLTAHIQHLFSEQTGLFAHGSYRGTTLWNYWGRGNAWMALSMVEFLETCTALNYSSPQINRIKEVLDQQLQSLHRLQPEYGIWDVLVDGQIENKGVLETSASAGIGAAMLRAMKYLPSAKNELETSGLLAIRAALAYINESGVLTRTSAGTVLQLIPFGYSVIRSDRLQLWGQGLALNALTALVNNLSA